MRTVIYLLLASCFAVPVTASAADGVPGGARAKLLHELSFTLIERVLFHVGERTKTSQLHQAGGSVSTRVLDNGDEIIRFEQFHWRNGPWEDYRLDGTFLLPASSEFTLVNTSPVRFTFIYPDKAINPNKTLSYDISKFRASVRDETRGEQDDELLSYAVAFDAPAAGPVRVSTVEPLRYPFNSVFNTLSSAKPAAGKIELHNHGKKAVMTVAPTPEHHTYQRVQIDVDGRTYQDDLRYLDQAHFPRLPAGL